MNTAFATSADVSMTGITEVYSSLIGYTAVNPLYFVDTIGTSTCMPSMYTRTSMTATVRPSPMMLGSLPVLNSASLAWPVLAASIVKGSIPTGPSFAGTTLKTFHNMDDAMPAMINRLSPEPTPHNFCTSSSISMTITLEP